MEIREIIGSQKIERDNLLSRAYVERENLETLKKALSHNIIKVIVGPRRTGKSVFALEALKGSDFAYLNFDDERLLSVTEYDDIIKGIKEIYGSTRVLFFDEIQNLPNWELFMNRLNRTGYNIIITGSNSRLLSKELSTHLTGRFQQFRIFPFSFREFLAAKKYEAPEGSLTSKEMQGEVQAFLTDYLETGGYPEVVVNGVEYGGYLKQIYESVIFKDIAQRYNVRAIAGLKSVGLHLMTNYGTLISYNSLKEISEMNSTTTAEKFAGYLSEAFLTFMIDRFSFKSKERSKSEKKVYVYDTGMASAATFQFSPNLGHKMENAVAVELLRRNHDGIFYYRTKNKKEVDFVVKDGLRVSELIQVCYEMADPKTREREISGIMKAAQEVGCDKTTIVTWDKDGSQQKKGILIHFVSLRNWLLNQSRSVENISK